MTTTTAPVLDADGLARSFGSLTAVDGVTFQIRPGETYGLLGPNGAGKTTTISMIAGLLRPDAGSVTVAGVPLGDRPIEAKRHIGLVPQDLAIYPELSARDNLTYFGRLQGLSGSRLRERVGAVLETVGLTDRAKGASKKFSGGMKRRLNIGIGLLHEPRLLILDEPTVGVDPQSRHAILESVEALSTEGMAVLYTTHYMEEAERLCDRIGIIDAGSLQAEGTRDELVDLIGGTDTVTLAGTGDLEAAERALADLAAVEQVHRDRGALRLAVKGAPRAISGIVNATAGAGMTLSDVEISRPDLEAVFLHLTGKALRD
ncbi:ABC transporter ATP-binding protein [Serinicoccus kebangsaanensis]|uniref:ABC transporter ATP-binding protein n=1 Tax=Serinicoccus kebangsaanensis TaxID=2602069 RepID=UPI001EE1B0F5|nr:ABC transporter ATP-binding protein [Serinicoccus kebangsaanensis]